MIEEILSVGIDIGTSTTQLIFSKIYIENRKDGVDIKIQFKKIDYKNE